MNALKDLPAGLVVSCVVSSIMFFVPTYVLHTACYPWLTSRRIRYDLSSHASVSLKNPFSTTDEQLRREWKNAMLTSVGGLGTAVLERSLVEMRIVHALPSDETVDWVMIARQFLVYFFLFDCYYYFLHRFFFHGKWGWRMHKVHHDSHVCCPSTGFSFHWFEGFVGGVQSPPRPHPPARRSA